MGARRLRSSLGRRERSDGDRSAAAARSLARPGRAEIAPLPRRDARATDVGAPSRNGPASRRIGRAARGRGARRATGEGEARVSRPRPPAGGACAGRGGRVVARGREGLRIARREDSLGAHGAQGGILGAGRVARATRRATAYDGAAAA